MKFFTTSVVVFFVLVGLEPASSDTHYVSKSGSNTYPYASWTSATDTVARAVEAAGEWDTIRIGPGHFVTDTVVMKKGQVVLGSGVDSTLLDTLPSEPLRAFQAADSCEISGLSFVGNFIEGTVRADFLSLQDLHLEVQRAQTAIICLDDCHLTVSQLRFVNMQVAIALFDNDISKAGRLCLVDSCEFYGFFEAILGFQSIIHVKNSKFAFDETAGSATIRASGGELTVEGSRFRGSDSVGVNQTCAIETSTSRAVIIRNCLMYSNLSGFALELNADGFTTPMSTAIVENNTFVRWVVHLRTHRPGWQFRNNLLVQCRVLPLWPSNLPVSTYNMTWDNTPWDSGMIAEVDTIPNDLPGNLANVNANPMFVDTVIFTLQAYSPAIDAGDPAVLDVDGSRSDIGYAGGAGGFGSAYPDLPPGPPSWVTASILSNKIEVKWRPGHEADHSYFRLYRDSIPITGPLSNLLLDTIHTDSAYVDSAVQAGRSYYYRLSAVDLGGAEGALSSEVEVLVTSVGEEEELLLPNAFEYVRVYPNPFNSAVSIALSVTRSGQLSLHVFDVRGALVDTIRIGAVTPGDQQLTWVPKDLSSGVYFLRAQLGGDHLVQKLLYLK